MAPVIKGKDVLNALNELKTPSKLTEIVDHMSANCEGSKTALTAAVKKILEAGVQYGYIQETEDKYYTENLTAENANDEQVQPTTSEPKELYKTNELISSSESLEVAKNERKAATNKRPMTSSKYFLNSSDDEEELRDRADCSGSRFRRRSRSRSSGKHGKSHSRRRTRRRRRG